MHCNFTHTHRSGLAALLVLGFGTAAAPLAHAAESNWYMHGGGLSHHFDQPKAAGRVWQKRHPGLGFERRTDFGTEGYWDLRYVGGVMQDSRGVWSSYGGAAWMRRWQFGADAEVGLGLSAQLFYKSKNWHGGRQVVPMVMPVASFGIAGNRVGVNATYAPRIAGVNDISVAFLQFVVRADFMR